MQDANVKDMYILLDCEFSASRKIRLVSLRSISFHRCGLLIRKVLRSCRSVLSDLDTIKSDKQSPVLDQTSKLRRGDTHEFRPPPPSDAAVPLIMTCTSSTPSSGIPRPPSGLRTDMCLSDYIKRPASQLYISDRKP